MKRLLALVPVPVWFLLVAVSNATPTPAPTPTPTPTPPASPSPSPSTIPTPVGAFLSLDPSAGGPSTQIVVTGSSFLAGEPMTLYWDTADRVAGSVTADSSGGFTKSVTAFPGDRPGTHRICASVQPNPCANFTLQGPPTPTPPASPSPSPAASPSAQASPTPSPSPSPLVLTSNSGRGGLDVITRPPFVFLPIIGLLALLGALAYWMFMRVDRPPVLPSASVVHRSARPYIGPPTGPRPAATPPPGPPAPETQWPPAEPDTSAEQDPPDPTSY
ncbi:MAG TPA: hypothetical protein VLR46_02250 [Candidatus Dormibacteraeota bacterium]|nr:hypothetical protein [Candidatus Dormibacteraeota bacterium]